ncbi:MAG: hypothetical protein Q9166_003702 [cf. Caloplaca sp. 2 TL-2023]
MKKQAALAGRRRRKVSALPSPAVPKGVKKYSKRKTKPDDNNDSSDAESDEESTDYVASKTMGGTDGPAETDDDDVSPRSVNKKRLSKRLQHAAVEDDDDEKPVPTRPRRTRASGVNYNLLQNSNFDQSEEVATDLTVEQPVKKSKIIALRTGTPRTPIAESLDPKIRKLRRSDNIFGDHEVTQTPTMQEDTPSRRMSTRGKKSTTGNRDQLLSPAAVAGMISSGSKRKRRPQEPESDVVSIDESKATRSSRKRKNSEVEVNEARPKKKPTVEPTSENEGEPSGKKKRRGKFKEHLGFLPNGQPRQRRRRVSEFTVILLQI